MDDFERVAGHNHPSYDPVPWGARAMVPRVGNRLQFKNPTGRKMLEAIRKRSASFVVKGLFVILILAFGVWGVGDVVRRTAYPTYVATVGEVEITPDQLGREIQRELSVFQQRTGANLTRDQARAMGIIPLALGNLVQRTLFGMAAADLGIAVSDKLLQGDIGADPTFQNGFGEFDPFLYEQMVGAQGLTPTGYESILRADLARFQLSRGLPELAKVPTSLLDLIYRFRQERRVAKTAFVADAGSGAIGAPDESQLQRYHEDNGARFTAPEYRAVSTVVLHVDDLIGEIAVEDDRLRRAYDERLDEFSTPEKRHLQQIVVADQESAERVHRRLVDGGEFMTVAGETDGVNADSVELGLVGRSDLAVPELATAAFALAEGAISEPVSSPFGWHIVRIQQIQPAKQQSFEEVRATLHQSLAREQATDAMFDLSARLEDTLAAGTTLEEAGSSLGLRLVRTDAIDATGRDPEGRSVELAAAAPGFLSEAFATPQGEESPLTESGPDGYFILRVDGVTAARLRPLETVRDEVLQSWSADERADAARQKAQSIVDRLNGGASIEAIAAETGLDVVTTPPFNRTGQSGETRLEAALVSNLFEKRVGEAGLARSTDGYTVGIVTEVIAPNRSQDVAVVDGIIEGLARSIDADLRSQFANALQNKFAITTNETAINEVF
jgi:peptidyl-prolyl cis-trans isomerase D